jgi:DinB superfamily
MKRFGLLALACAMALPMFGQAGAAKSDTKTEPETVTSVLHKQLSSTEREVVETADAMPADKYNFAPTQGDFKDVRDFEGQAAHVAMANKMYANAIMGNKPGSDEPQKGPIGKDKVMADLKDSFALLHKAFDTINEKNATEPIASPFGSKPTTRLAIAISTLTHCFDHYGQMVEYLRMNGIVPPASQKQNQRASD